jgi:hypothetical protein
MSTEYKVSDDLGRAWLFDLYDLSAYSASNLSHHAQLSLGTVLAVLIAVPFYHLEVFL